MATFFFVVLVLVPIIVFSLSAFFALILWVIECAEQRAEGSESERSEEASGAEGVDEASDAAHRRLSEEINMCIYYEWFKYVVGNLVGVSLTNVGDGLSGHVLAEIVDLLVSTWSLAVTGSVVSLVGGLGLMATMTEKLDGVVSGSTALHDELLEKASTKSGLDLRGFQQLVEDRRLPVSHDQTLLLFSVADADDSGTLDPRECEKLIKLVQMIVPPEKHLAKLEEERRLADAIQLAVREAAPQLARAVAEEIYTREPKNRAAATNSGWWQGQSSSLSA